MNSALESVATTQAVNSAELVIVRENRRLKAEEKKRRLLAFNFGSDAAIPENAAGNLLRSVTSVAVPIGLTGLMDTGHIFLRRAGQEFVEKFFDLPNRYDVLNSDGEIILYAGETQEEFGSGRDCFGTQGPIFDVSVIAVQGGGLLSITSHQRVTTISDFQNIIGTIIDTGTPFGPHERYTIRDWNMSEVFRLRKCKGEPRGEFDVFNKTNLFVAKFTSNWNTDMPNYVGVDQLYGVTFPPDMDISEKILLLGALFAMHFQTLHGDVSDRNGKCWAYCFLITAISLLLLILLGVLLLIFL